MNLDRQLYQVYQKKNASHRSLFHPFGQDKEEWTLCFLDVTPAAVTMYECTLSKESESRSEVFRYSKLRGQLKLLYQWSTESIIVTKRSCTDFAFQCDKRSDNFHEFRTTDATLCQMLLCNISFCKGVIYQLAIENEITINQCIVDVMQPDGTELEPLSARCCSARNAMKAILRMSTNHVTITRQQHSCEWCDNVSAEVLVSRSTRFLNWYKLEDQGTKIRLHFSAGYESGDAFLHPEVEYLLRVEDSSDMQALITMMPGSIISSLWFGGLYYTEYDEILSITVNEFMRRRGCEPVRRASEGDRFIPLPRTDSLKQNEIHTRSSATFAAR
ncbi:hypothetical protein BC937DRAFT_93140 [Endogone sp. FLAS-F59071]|nr:hypothetical protein BC937DRAFT_93140 [Endogone sp. FLAS-F59071]|eukprot:RUS14936.1 hypothetical protein BC937DRAFT_93140 [Endogone sp. FLAS-F59071]